MFRIVMSSFTIGSVLCISPFVISREYQQRKFNQFVKERKRNYVRLLLWSPKVDPSKNYDEAMGDACKNKDIPMVKLLLTDKRTLTSNICSLYVTKLLEDMELFKILIKDERINVSKAMAWTSLLGRKEMFDILIKHERVNVEGMNQAIYWAVVMERKEMFDALVKDPRISPDILQKIKDEKPEQWDKVQKSN